MRSPDRSSLKNVGLRLGFAGTPAFAATVLSGLSAAELTPVVVFTQPDRPTGRGRTLKPSPVKALAASQGIGVLQPQSLKGVSLEEYALDMLIVVAYGLLLPAHVLKAPRLGCLNVHASLLPRWRGAAPIERAIIAGDNETGVCLMQMDEGLDTGPIYACRRTAIDDDETGGSLDKKLAALGTRLLLEHLPEIAALTPTPQSETGITYAHKLTSKDSVLDWNQSAETIACRVRALADRGPVCVFSPGSEPPARIRLLGASVRHAVRQEGTLRAPPGTCMTIDRSGMAIACGHGCLVVPLLQLNRGKGTPMSAVDVANGYPSLIAPGLTLMAQPESSF